ncbi:MAG: hypothetical protein JSV50_06445 [Desulfobacteraceae bacterium]|nr:MAG: hypothetical protein JSV50_06445 [Desulfobacteraceae bacterium]
MNRKETKEKRPKGGCNDFESNFKSFQEMFEGMSKCCMGQDGSIDCSAIMDRMKTMMEMCCASKEDSTKSDHEPEKA